jgi:hypothetical protein
MNCSASIQDGIVDDPKTGRAFVNTDPSSHLPHVEGIASTMRVSVSIDEGTAEPKIVVHSG